jgi:RNA polymerase sigma-70 factor (ECF subfamily)
MQDPGEVRALPASFEEVYERMERPLMAICAAILGRRDLAEEAFQEALLQCFRMRSRWGEWKRPRAYLFQVARRAALRLREREARHPASSEALPLLEAKDPSDPALLARREALERALLRLPDVQRQAVVLKQLSGLTLPEVAEAMEENLKTTESRYAAGMAKLKEMLSHG